MTIRVLVPLVDARGEAAHLFEAIAGEIPPEDHPARLVPQIAELFDFGLYGIGQSAREAVKSFVEARRRRLWLSPRNGALKPWHLRISDLQLGRLSDGNARSAGLGLTIAALCQTFDRDPGLIFATGEILPNAPGSAAAGVGPVSGMRGKLALIGDYIAQHGPTLEGQPVVVALPSHAEDGRPLEEAERSLIARLREQAEDARVKLTLIFADTLEALEAPLGPFAIREVLTPRRALAAAAARRRVGRDRRALGRARPCADPPRLRGAARRGRGQDGWRRRAATGEMEQASRPAHPAEALRRLPAPAAADRRRRPYHAGPGRGWPALRQPRASDPPVYRLRVAERASRHSRRRAFSRGEI